MRNERGASQSRSLLNVFLDDFTFGGFDDGWRTFKTKHNEKIIVNVLRPEMLAKGMGTVEFMGCRL